METLIACLGILVISALIVDWTLKSEEGLRHGLQSSAKNIAALHTEEVLYTLTIWFSDVFDTIYGKRTWSWRRIFRSTCLSAFFVLFSVLIIGFENSYVKSFSDHESVLLITSVFLTINFVIDFVSLQQTRWVIYKVKEKRGNFSFLVWILIDLAFTAAIYVFMFGVLVFAISWAIDGIDTAVEEIFPIAGSNMLFAPDKLLPFFVSTFGTSIIWYLFMIFSIVTRIMGQRSTLLAIGWQVLFESETPGRIVAFFVGILLIVAFAVFKLAIQFLGVG